MPPLSSRRLPRSGFTKRETDTEFNGLVSADLQLAKSTVGKALSFLYYVRAGLQRIAHPRSFIRRLICLP
jgi:hypothetical protein